MRAAGLRARASPHSHSVQKSCRPAVRCSQVSSLVSRASIKAQQHNKQAIAALQSKENGLFFCRAMTSSLREVLTRFPGAKGADLRRFLGELDQLDSPHKFAVIKAGGAVLEGAELDAFVDAVAVFNELGLRPIIVHGGGPQLNKELEAAGVEPQFVRGVRVTDEPTLEVAVRVFGDSNARLVDALEARGVRARPFHGNVFEAELLDEATYGNVGRVTNVNDQRIAAAVRQGYVPCVSSLGSTRAGRALNINADIAARDLALKVRPQNIVYLNSTGGLYDDLGNTIPAINLAEDFEKLIAQPWVKHGTRLKLEEIKAILDALPAASSVSILKPQDLVSELFSRAGAGTLVRTGERMLRYDSPADVRAQVDMTALRVLFESAFGGTLVPGYFEELFADPPEGTAPRLAHLYVTESMRAAAVITREAGAPDGALYMDKLAVHNSYRGLGIAQLLWQQICKDVETMFWRSRVKNSFNAWYYRQCDGSFQTDEWVVYFYGLRKLRDGERCVAIANAKPVSINRTADMPQPSFGADAAAPRRKTTPAPRIRQSGRRSYTTDARGGLQVKRVAVVGARGYVGGELAGLLSGHERLQLTAAFSRSEAGKPVNTRFAPGLLFTDSTPESVVASRPHVIVLALPNNASAPYVEAVLKYREQLKFDGVDPSDEEHPAPIVVDVSADGRFSPGIYAYGLPEVGDNRESIKKAVLVANPGCYATATQLALWPLVKSGLVAAGGQRAPPAVFAISGYSGAGSMPSRNNDPAFMADSLLPYSPMGHVHEREVSARLGLPIHFMPHVAPYFRGIQVTVNAEMTRESTVDEVRAAFVDAYQGEPLVNVTDEPVRARSVANTPGGIVGGFAVKGSRVVVNAAIDNLLKGAASQAVQNINLALGLDEFSGLQVPKAEEAPVERAVRDPNAVFVNTYNRPSDIVLTKGDGITITDEAGKTYLDFTSGIAVNAFGHLDRPWIAAVTDQLNRIAHTSNLMHSRPSADLAAEIVRLTPFSERVFLCNSGTEANEAALKFARVSNPRGTFVSCKGSFHGRSMGALSVTHKPAIRTPFEPLLDCAFIPFNTATDAEVEASITDSVAAVIVEPVQGEGGCVSATSDFLARLRARCDAVGAALIYDEVQSGFGRTGSLHAYEGIGAPAPDMITWAKPLGGGLPIGAVAVNSKFASHIKPGMHGTTFGGNAAVAAGALSTLRRLAQPDLLRAVVSRGERLVEAFSMAIGPENLVSVRGQGLLRGFEVAPPLTAASVVSACREEGLLLVGTDNPQVVRALPALTVGDDAIADAAARLKRAIANLQEQQR